MSELLLINEKGARWDPNLPAEETSYSIIVQGQESFLTSEEFTQTLEHLKGKKILVLIHGLNNPKETVLFNWGVAHQNINSLSCRRHDSYWTMFRRFFSAYTGLWAPKTQKVYDAIIGISWPSFAHELYYYNAKKNAEHIAPKVKEHLNQMTQVAGEVDVIAHSLGNYLLFQALAHSSLPSKIHTIFSVAAAVPSTSLNYGNLYHQVASACKHLFVLYSHQDSALYWPFFLAERGKNALGLTGPNLHDPLPTNVSSINCTQVINHHSAYLFKQPFYRFIERFHNREYDSKIGKHPHFFLDELANLHS